MEANIEAIVNDLQNVTVEHTLFEAIMNSIQAHATTVDVTLYQSSILENDTTPYINRVEIKDNGDGFTEENTKSFKQYRSTYKKSLGAKGIGRFLYLKLFDKVSIDSLDKHIDFTVKNDVQVTSINKQDYSIVKFEKPKNNLFINLENLETNIKEHFLPYFSLFKKDEKVIINVYENETKLFSIDSSRIPPFETDEFNVKNHKFKIKYILNSDEVTKNDGFYCANNRVVIKNSELDSKIKLRAFKDVNVLFLLSGEYFDNNVNDERNEFSIFPNRTNQENLFGNLSWVDIQETLTQKLKEIFLKNNIDLESRAKTYLSEAIEQAPYLASYLQNNDYGYKSDVLINSAKRKLEEDKKFLRQNDDKFDDDYKVKLSIVTQSELAEYIFDRQKIIERLKKLTSDEALEKEIHNLFMKQKTIDEKNDYKSNHLWLFDDRFMIYDKVFSDKQIKDIFPELSSNLERPDILSVVSNTHITDDITDIVIIELKKPDTNITPAGAEEQLLKYSRYVSESNLKNKVRIWTYAFLKYSDETDELLGDKDYNKIPTHSEYPIYYKYHEKRNTIINFMDFRALAFDADNRNKTFMNILTGKTIDKEEIDNA